MNSFLIKVYTVVVVLTMHDQCDLSISIAILPYKSFVPYPMPLWPV